MDSFIWSLVFTGIDATCITILVMSILKIQMNMLVRKLLFMVSFQIPILLFSTIFNIPIAWLLIITMPILIKFAFRNSLFNSMIIYLISFDILLVTQLLIAFFIKIFNSNFFFEDVIIGLFSQILCLFICVLIKLFVDITVIYNLLVKKNIVVVFIFCVVTSTLILLLFILKKDDYLFWEILFNSSVIIFSLAIIAITSFINQLKMFAKTSEIEMSKKMFAEIDDVVSKIIGRQHENDNHIQSIISLVNSEDDVEELREQVQNYFSNYQISQKKFSNIFSQLNRKTVESLIYAKLIKAEELRLNFLVDIEPVDIDAKIEDYTLNEIICCLVDNAIESSDENSNIMLNIFMQDNKLTIEVKNEHPELKTLFIKQMFNKGFSTSLQKNKDQIRGYGLYNLKRTIEEQHGRLIVFNKEINGINNVVFRVIL